MAEGPDDGIFQGLLTQPSINFAAERQRRQQLIEKYVVLRNLLPNHTKSDRVSVVEGAIDYIKVLLRTINELKTIVDKKRERSQKTEEPMEIQLQHQQLGLTETKTLAAERQRRRQLDEKCEALRNLLPNHIKSDRLSVVQGAIDYIKELRRTGGGGLYQDGEVDQFDNCVVQTENFAAEPQRRQQLDEKYEALRSLLPFLEKSDRASILEQAVRYVNVLRINVKELAVLLDKKIERSKRQKAEEDSTGNNNGHETCSIMKPLGGDHPYQSFNDGSFRSPWLQRKSKDTEVDVRIIFIMLLVVVILLIIAAFFSTPRYLKGLRFMQLP